MGPEPADRRLMTMPAHLPPDRVAQNQFNGHYAIAERISRPGRMRSAHTPATMRSERQRLGDRLRDRLRISSWCLRSTDSATTDGAPPGPASRATVASRCRNRTARSRSAQSYQDRDIVRTLTNLQLATHRRSTRLRDVERAGPKPSPTVMDKLGPDTVFTSYVFIVLLDEDFQPIMQSTTASRRRFIVCPLTQSVGGFHE